MEHLIPIKREHPWWHVHKIFRKYYFLSRPYTTEFPEYGENLTADVGVYDGSSGGLDDCPEFWLPHDQACKTGKWDSGRPITRKQAASITRIIAEKGKGRNALIRHGYSFRAWYTKWATYWLGCSKVKGQ